jgi:hypothetical protein
MVLGDIVTVMSNFPVSHIKVWRDTDNAVHYISLGFDSRIILKSLDKSMLNAEDTFRMTGSTLGYDNEDVETITRVKEPFNKYLTEGAFYRSDVESRCLLTFAGHNLDHAVTGFINSPEDDFFAYNPAFSSTVYDDAEYVPVIQSVMSQFLLGQRLQEVQKETNDEYLSMNADTYRFTFSNQAFINSSCFGFEDTSQKTFIRYTPDRGLEVNPSTA